MANKTVFLIPILLMTAPPTINPIIQKIMRMVSPNITAFTVKPSFSASWGAVIE